MSEKKSGNDETKDARKKTRSQKFKECGSFIWNSEQKSVLGRTAGSWAQIGLFYLIFYGSLAGFFAVCLAVFLHTLDDVEPRQKNMYSLLKSNPGMGFRPYMVHRESTLISFKAFEPQSYKEYLDNLDITLKVYESQTGKNVVDCSMETRTDDEVCEFPLSLLGENCTSDQQYGYSRGRPCVLLKINKIFDWSPVPYDNASFDALPNETKKRLNYQFDPDYVGVTCEGETDADADNIRGITFNPEKGFSSAYFPYHNQPNYLTPVVMVQFDVKPGRLVMFWCKLWSKNIRHHKNDLQGSVHFELLVDYKEE